MLFTRRIVVALLLAVVAVGPAQAVERILRFVSDAEVQRNGDLAVTETIRVQAEGNQIRHGIFRDFPTTYARPDGSRVVVGFDVQSVTRDGTADNCHRGARKRRSRTYRSRRGDAAERRARIRHPLSHHAADRLFRRL
jgi:hypothetical protein